MAYRNIHARPVQQLAAIEPAAAQATAPASPISFDMQTGSIIYTQPGAAPMKIPVIPGLISALAVKIILFGGKKVGTYAAGKAKTYLKRT